ncbi:MAG: hypothetical protein HC881_12695 [Leptolyngbyaceae cyanobacterium SL_7_1]|nr:hypothetical protein [Leptolyngbyaceae cyanobacterium SL_7_1]
MPPTPAHWQPQSAGKRLKGDSRGDRLGTRNPAILYQAAVIEQALDRPTEAQKYFQQVKAIDPTFDVHAQQSAYLGVGLEF